MRYSIIIPNLNSPIIHHTIESLEAQCQAFDAEVLVVGKDAPGLVEPSRLVRFVDTGVPVIAAVARNRGVDLAHGEILCFLDADCIPRADWLKRIHERFEDPQVQVVGGGVDTNQRGYWSLCDHVSSFHEYLVTCQAGIRLMLPSLNLVMRRSVFDSVGGFAERPAGEDADLTTRLRLDGYLLQFDPRMVVSHLPARHTASQAIEHALLAGCYSIKVDPAWRARLHPAFPLRHPLLLLLFSPVLALGTTLRIYLGDRSLWKWWHLMTGIFALKLAWCWGAARSMFARRGSMNQQKSTPV
jgi:cellulose synthase/poly-beta-1,6-N-acetylglucosamine synthase-like glycosyltransferase